jgi:ribonucleoside-diphosphate reductase alpha chain
MTAYLSGCKGMTVYRDGCRDGVLSSGNKQKGELNYTDAPKRPSKLECDIYSKTALGKDFTIIVGLMDEKPFEIFAFSQIHQVDFPKEIKRGVLQKIKSGAYKLSGFKGDKEYFIDNIITLMDDNESTNTRRYSLKLRHGIDPIHITDQIDKYANITSFDKVIGRVLKNYLNGKKTGSLCPNCNSNLVIQEGCEKCLNCAYSKCG